MNLNRIQHIYISSFYYVSPIFSKDKMRKEKNLIRSQRTSTLRYPRLSNKAIYRYPYVTLYRRTSNFNIPTTLQNNFARAARHLPPTINTQLSRTRTTIKSSPALGAWPRIGNERNPRQQRGKLTHAYMYILGPAALREIRQTRWLYTTAHSALTRCAPVHFDALGAQLRWPF